MESLNLSKPVEYPFLENVLDKGLLIKHIANGLVAEHLATDTVTRVYHYTSSCEQQKAWDAVTTLCKGLVVQCGRVIGRPIPKSFEINTPGFPETKPENFGPSPEVTDMLDGFQATMYLNAQKHPMLVVGRDPGSVVSLKASMFYRRNFGVGFKDGAAVWPEGYTPVFQFVGPSFRRVTNYMEDKLVLVGLVCREDGTELPYNETAGWANHNNIPMVECWQQAPSEALGAYTAHRGFVFKWAMAGREAPLRVYVQNPQYEHLRKVLFGWSPYLLWKAMRDKQKLDALKDRQKMPGDFVEWVEKWEAQITATRKAAEERMKQLARECGAAGKLPLVGPARTVVVQKIADACMPSSGQYLAGAIAFVDDRPTEPYAWEIARTEVMSARKFREG